MDRQDWITLGRRVLITTCLVVAFALAYSPTAPQPSYIAAGLLALIAIILGWSA